MNYERNEINDTFVAGVSKEIDHFNSLQLKIVSVTSDVVVFLNAVIPNLQ
jgi:hypothetical protein